jgi:DNA-binding MarR family transcriptional regulator
MASHTASPPEAPEKAEDPGRLAADLRLVIGRMARRLRQRGDSGVTASLLSAMWTIERLKPVSLGDLAAAERVQPPSVTRHVAKLEEMGLVAREADGADRRVSRVTLTPEGHRLLDRTRRLRTAYLSARLRSLPQDDRQALRRAVDVLTGILEEEDPR